MTPLRKVAIGVAAATLALAGLGVALYDGETRSLAPIHAAPAATTPAATPAADPYAVYLASNPKPDLVLTREDAQTRAYLGCGTTFAPGTVDAALAAAYRPGICGKAY